MNVKKHENDFIHINKLGIETAIFCMAIALMFSLFIGMGSFMLARTAQDFGLFAGVSVGGTTFIIFSGCLIIALGVIGYLIGKRV